MLVESKLGSLGLYLHPAKGVGAVDAYGPIIEYWRKRDSNAPTADLQPFTISTAQMATICGGRSDQGSLRIHNEPADPGPGEGVTVVAEVLPPSAGVSVSFSIVGTDGYSKSVTTPTDAQGMAFFFIPGGAGGVTDHVTVTLVASGVTQYLQYVF